MKTDANFQIIKDIPLKGGQVLKEGTMIYRLHGVYYMDQGIITPDYQEDFDRLIEADSKRIPKYIVRVKQKVWVVR